MVIDENMKVGNVAWQRASLKELTPENCILRFRIVRIGENKQVIPYFLIKYTEKVSENHYKTRTLTQEDIANVPPEEFTYPDSTYYVKTDGKVIELKMGGQRYE